MNITNLLTPEEAAEFLGIKPETMSIWRSTGRYPLRFIRVGRLIRYSREDLEEFIQKRSALHTGQEAA